MNWRHPISKRRTDYDFLCTELFTAETGRIELRQRFYRLGYTLDEVVHRNKTAREPAVNKFAKRPVFFRTTPHNQIA